MKNNTRSMIHFELDRMAESLDIDILGRSVADRMINLSAMCSGDESLRVLVKDHVINSARYMAKTPHGPRDCFDHKNVVKIFFYYLVRGFLDAYERPFVKRQHWMPFCMISKFASENARRHHHTVEILNGSFQWGEYVCNQRIIHDEFIHETPHYSQIIEVIFSYIESDYDISLRDIRNPEVDNSLMSIRNGAALSLFAIIQYFVRNPDYNKKRIDGDAHSMLEAIFDSIDHVAATFKYGVVFSHKRVHMPIVPSASVKAFMSGESHHIVLPLSRHVSLILSDKDISATLKRDKIVRKHVHRLITDAYTNGGVIFGMDKARAEDIIRSIGI